MIEKAIVGGSPIDANEAPRSISSRFVMSQTPARPALRSYK
jgi:hypothetical protein